MARHSSKAKDKDKVDYGDRVVASNRRARHNFDILDTYECGIMLRGSEVKSLREANVTIADAFGVIRDDELWLLGLYISPYKSAGTHTKLESERPRKLLMHRQELDRIIHRLDTERLTLVPMSLYFVNGKAKLEMAMARGRKAVDRRQAIAKRDAERETQRALRRRTKYGD